MFYTKAAQACDFQDNNQEFEISNVKKERFYLIMLFQLHPNEKKAEIPNGWTKHKRYL